MKFLIDGSLDRINTRVKQCADLIAGQLLTPLTRYTRVSDVFAIDNGAFTRFRQDAFVSLLEREKNVRDKCLFVCVPDRVYCHKTTLSMWQDMSCLCEGWRKAFVAQDGYDGMPCDADALFIGGSDQYKNSAEVLEHVSDARVRGKHVHVGRVNGPERFMKFRRAGAHTCDGSGVSRYDHMLLRIHAALNSPGLFT